MSPGTGGASAEAAVRAEFPRGLGDFLVALALAAHRYAMYPSDHPSLRNALEACVREIGRVLHDRGSLAVAARDGRLVVDSVISDESHTLLADLARRMEEHQLGALVFRRGVTLEEMSGVLDALSRDAHHPESALGLLPVQERPSWEHALLQPVGYEFLHPSEPGGDRHPRSVGDLWFAFAEAAGEASRTDADGTGEAVPDGRAIARALSGAPPSSVSRFTSLWTRLLDELAWDRSTAAQRVREQVESLVGALSPEVCAPWFTAADLAASDREGGSPPIRPSERFLMAVARAELHPGAVSRLCQVLSMAEDPPISPVMARSLGRLANLRTDSPSSAADPEAGSAIRSLLEQTVMQSSSGRPGVAPGRWRGADGETDVGQAPGGQPLTREEALRVVRISLDVDRGGPSLERALRRLVRSGDLSPVIEWTEAAPSSSRAARRIEEYLMTPEQLRLLLSGEDVDDASLTAIVNRLGNRALDALFDRLAGSESRTIRRKIFDCLTAMGERVSGTVMTYLEDPPWFVQRNMLALLQRMPTLPAGFSPLQHLSHEDARVRREALPLALRVPGTREEALKLALSDPDERIVRMALLELQEGVPDSVVPSLVVSGLTSPTHRELGSLAARALGRSQRPDARDALLDRSVVGGARAGEGPIELLDRDPTMLAALVSLIEGWPDDPTVRRLVEAGRESADPQVRSTVGRMDASGNPSDG